MTQQVTFLVCPKCKIVKAFQVWAVQDFSGRYFKLECLSCGHVIDVRE